MGKGSGDGIRSKWYSEARTSEKRQRSGGNATTAAVDGLQFPLTASQSQHPAGFSVGVDARQDTELAAESVLPTPDFVVLDEVPKFSELTAESVIPTPNFVVLDEVPKKNSWQATERATSGVPEGLGGRNEDSEKALDVEVHWIVHELEELDRAAGVFHEVVGTSLRFFRNLSQKLCETSLPNGEKAGESSDAPGKNLSVSKKLTGVGQRNGKFFAEIYLPIKKGRVWLGTFNTEEAAYRAYQFAAEWRQAHRDKKSFSKEEEDVLQKLAKKAGEHLSDDRSHHKVAPPDLAATVASSKGKAVASAEPVSQRKSPAYQNASSPDWGSLPNL